jgi:hypothetical protein
MSFCSFQNSTSAPVPGLRSRSAANRESQKSQKRRQSLLDKHYSTWNDEYAGIDRFFLYCSPFLFFIFNFFYWGYFYYWALYFTEEENSEDIIEMPDP